MLQGLDYVPLLYTKRAELRALKYLDKPVRDRIFPVLAVRPWPNTKEFAKIVSKLDEATAGYRHGFDLDRHKRGLITKEPCATSFNELFDPADGFSKFYSLVEEVDDRVPVLRTINGVFDALDDQFSHIDRMHRGVIVRLERGFSDNISNLLSSGYLEPADTLFLVDAGWCDNVIAQEMWASRLISQITDWDVTAEIACLSSSFPNSFTHIEYKGTFSIDDRELFNRLVRRHNSANLTYGDWGSTRQSEEAGGGTHYDRIDTARAGDWVSFRQTGDEVGYRVVAQRATKDTLWGTLPSCWGKYSIECTALGIPGAIVGTEAAISSRINMHITAQAGVGAATVLPDEPYSDPF